MFLEEISSLLKKRLSPELFKLPSEVYGIQYGSSDPKKIIKKIMLTLDLSVEAVHFAVINKVNLIISHQGLINNSIKKFSQYLIKKLSLLSKYPISIFVLNSSFISAEGGVSETIRKALFLNLDSTFKITKKNGEDIPIGRICVPKYYPNQNGSLKLKDLINRIKTNLELKKITYVGDLNKTINKICIIGGLNSNLKTLEKAVKEGCDCYITCDIGYNEAIFAKEAGVILIKISHFKTGIISLQKLNNILSLEFPLEEFFFFESKDPFNIYED